MIDTTKESDLIVIGAGLAGMAATAFALESGLETIQIGATAGEMHFASGVLDLLGVYPVEQQHQWGNPWAGITALIQDQPEHPYGRVGLENIRNAWKAFLTVLERAGLRYCGWPERNAVLATCAGTLKLTYQVPITMWPGVIGLKEKCPALIVDFEGMKDFSAVQMVKTIGSNWPGLRAQRLRFPYPLKGLERQNVFMAEALRSSEVQNGLADSIGPFLQDAETVGMPAIHGLRQPEAVAENLERQLGVPVFEIPTLPPSVPGLRLKQAMEQELMRAGAVLLSGRRAVRVDTHGRRGASVVLETGQSQETLEARGVVLATGRFLGGGLAAGRSGIRETLLDLPIHQPQSRRDWHRPRFLDPSGHPVNRAGLVVDDSFRPLGQNGSTVHRNIFAAGSVLAHQDWKRMKCGAGLAIATAYGAVQSFVHCSC